MLIYPVTLRGENGAVLVEVPDLPEAATVGRNETEALMSALASIETALQACFYTLRPVPVPSSARKEQPTVALSALKTAKILLWNEMVAQHVDKAELARRLHVPVPQVDRLFDLQHSSELDFIELAAKALGKAVELILV